MSGAALTLSAIAFLAVLYGGLIAYGVWKNTHRNSRPFVPSARYHSSMNLIEYTTEDVSWTSQEVDRYYFTVCWDPTLDHLVGFQIRNISHLLGQQPDRESPALAMLLLKAKAMSEQADYYVSTEERDRLFTLAANLLTQGAALPAAQWHQVVAAASGA